ncbi:fructoselysine 6-kinase [Arthrobacter sp. V4I6]|uniref:PfkB family carbohydrate kinase n=1 Tax=unclassified Arthrobacter TaxID=235627 RepID=UPI00277DACFF|nr:MULTISPECIES: PfkB family carbohydrate kinase [unclassified Arthrobacter]MDQ0820350.1 fructoselysine 6-kinase [Arthrobacter sp. V1I7]MDQ0854531.1 fructoselysine 6-kinase [Arthrobacter sp. V4I6]
MMVSILTARDNVVDCYLDEGQVFAGGNALNVAVFARRAGARAAYAGTVGTDAAGALIRSALTLEGVSTDFLQVKPGSTAYCVIGRNNGDRVFREVGLGVSQANFDGGFVAPASGFDAVHLSVSSALEDLVPDLASVSRLSFDFSTNRNADLLSAVAQHCYLASFSGGDLTGPEGLDLARHAIALGATWALVTRGGDGAVLVSREHSYEVQAANTTLVDTLGAGDTFMATLLTGLLQAKDPHEAMTRASEASAQTCSRLGAFGKGKLLAALPLPTHQDAVPLDVPQ